MSNTEIAENAENQQQSWELQHFISLPTELQTRILSYLNVQTHVIIRKLNEMYKILSNHYWQNELTKTVLKAQSEHLASEENAILQALKISSEIFNQNGYASIFWDCLLPYLFGSEKARLQNINQEKFQDFLMSFFIDNLAYIRIPQYLRALSAMTILQLLKCFPTSEITLEETEQCLHIHIEINNIWLGTTFEYRENQKIDYLPVALTLLLYVCSLKRTAAYTETYQGTTYTYGYEHQKFKRSFSTEFDIYIEGTEELQNHIRTWLTSSYELAFFPQRIFCEDFSFRIQIELKGRVRNYWPQKIFVKLG